MVSGKDMKSKMALLIIPIVMGGCAGEPSKQDVGTVVGGVSGALIGSQFGHGGGRVAGAAIGGVVGSVAGSQIGKSMDIQDQQMADLRAQQAADRRMYYDNREVYGGRYYNPERENQSGYY